MPDAMLGVVRNVRQRRVSYDARDLVLFDDCYVIAKASKLKKFAMDGGGARFGVGGMVGYSASRKGRDVTNAGRQGAGGANALVAQHADNERVSFANVASVRLSKNMLAPAVDITLSDGRSDHWMWDRQSNKIKDVEALLRQAFGTKLVTG
jgi:hypothetical protein